MKKYIGVIALMAAIAFSACAHTKKAARKHPHAAKGKMAISAITMSRGACFGRCPVYTLSITASGAATFEGQSSAPFPGTYRKQYDPAAVASLFRLFSEYRVDTCKDSYVVTISDLPGLDYIFTINGKQKHIRNAGFGPRFLANMSQQVDEAVHVDSTWKKIKDLPKEQQ